MAAAMAKMAYGISGISWQWHQRYRRSLSLNQWRIMLAYSVNAMKMWRNGMRKRRHQWRQQR